MGEVREKIWLGVKIIVSIAVVFVAIFTAFYLVDILLNEYHLGKEDKYEFFRDIIIINLSIIGVIFAAIIFWIQLYITEKIKNDVEDQLKHRDDVYLDYVQGTTLLTNGYILWLTYDTTGEETLLNAAIAQTELAYTYIKGLDDKDPRYVLAKCQTKNNWGYYLAAKEKPEDKEYAIRCAEFIKNKIDDYPDYRAEWMDTYKYIMSKKWEIKAHAGSQGPKAQDQ
ncbi:hypothetical protein C4E24_00920 [ANME-1 cluster archaeon AG-394-G21]|nr:hypothetical protein [ANME-1 cluster archaeon AG-394-G21]